MWPINTWGCNIFFSLHDFQALYIGKLLTWSGGSKPGEVDPCYTATTGSHSIKEIKVGGQGDVSCNTVSCSPIAVKIIYWVNNKNNLWTKTTKKWCFMDSVPLTPLLCCFGFFLVNTENAFDNSFNVHCLGFNGKSELRALKVMQAWTADPWNCIHNKLYAKLIPAHSRAF